LTSAVKGGGGSASRPGRVMRKVLHELIMKAVFVRSENYMTQCLGFVCLGHEVKGQWNMGEKHLRGMEILCVSKWSIIYSNLALFSSSFGATAPSGGGPPHSRCF